MQVSRQTGKGVKGPWSDSCVCRGLTERVIILSFSHSLMSNTSHVVSQVFDAIFGEDWNISGPQVTRRRTAQIIKTTEVVFLNYFHDFLKHSGSRTTRERHFFLYNKCTARIRTWQGSEEPARGHRSGWPQGSHWVWEGVQMILRSTITSVWGALPHAATADICDTVKKVTFENVEIKNLSLRFKMSICLQYEVLPNLHLGFCQRNATDGTRSP